MTNGSSGGKAKPAPKAKAHNGLSVELFVDSATELDRLGWHPIPLVDKRLRVKGHTGYGGEDVHDAATYRQWAQDNRGAVLSLGVRMPEGVIGIDVDCYDGKHGAATLADHEEMWGPLPPTWSVTARTDGSRKLFFRVPVGWTGRGILGPGVEVIQRHHRYAVVPPSVHATGNVVKVLGSDGSECEQLPAPAQLPVLPTAWCDGLSSKSAPLSTTAECEELLAQIPSGAVSPEVSEAVAMFDAQLESGEDRHTAMLRAQRAVLTVGAMGYAGASDGVALLRVKVLEEAMNGGSKRTFDEIEQDWDRALLGAGRQIAGMRRELEALGPGGIWHKSAQWVETEELDDDGEKLWTRVAASHSADEESDPNSWTPIDVALVLASGPPAPPAVLRRTDGQCLFYVGKVHSVHGESESGKSWLVQCAAAQELTASGSVLYVDFEDSVESVVGRLRLLGVPTETLTDPARFAYVRPEESLATEQARQAFDSLLGRDYTLAVVDGVTDAMGLFGLSAKDNDDISTWQRELPRRIARATGAAVVCIDHVTKDADTRGRFAIGGQHKIAGLDGAAYIVEVEQPFAQGLVGGATVRVGKDRPGQVRGVGVGWRKTDRTQLIGEFTLDSTSPDRIAWSLAPPPPEGKGRPGKAQRDRSTPSGPTRSTWCMELVSKYLEGTSDPDQRTQNKTIEAMREARKAEGRPEMRNAWREAIEALIDEGYVETSPGARKAHVHDVVKPYREARDPESDKYAGDGSGVQLAVERPDSEGEK